MPQTLDDTIEQIENLYESVTGRTAPKPAQTPYAVIPPEKDPEIHIGEQIERLLSSLTPFARPTLEAPRWVPRAFVFHAKDHVLIQLDLPGVPRDAVRVRVSNGVLQVSGTRTAPDAPRGAYYSEQPFGAFQRWIAIPSDVAGDQVQARLEDGVLTVRAPKLAPSAVEEKDIVVS